MKLVKESLIGHLNEDMQKAKKILKELRIPETDQRFQELKSLLLSDNKPGYMGTFTKWIFKDREPWDKIIEIYDMIKNHKSKIKSIQDYDKLEDLFDFLQGSGITTKVNQVIKAIPSRARALVNDNLRKLLELNIQYEKPIKDFYSKKGGRFTQSNNLYNETEALIKNLSGGFSLTAMLKKIKDTNAKVEVVLDRPDLLVLRPKDYHASEAMGSKSWCISYSRNYWDSYVDVFSNQYFIYDFSKELSDKKCMIGVTINPDKSFKAAHFKDDSAAPHNYIEELFADE